MWTAQRLLLCVACVIAGSDQTYAQGRRAFGGGGGAEDGGRPRSFGGDRGGFRGGPAGGSRGGSSMISRLDRNGDGRIDQMEINSIPPQFRQIMEARGVQLRPSSVQDFGDSMRQQFERLRQSREGGEASRGGSVQPTPPPAAGNRESYTPAAPFRPRDKERMTIDLPPKYTELDSDYDGQVGLYEWIVSRRDALDVFDQIDTDQDAILTPEELQNYEEAAESTEQILAVFKEKYARPRLMIVSANGINSSDDGSRGTSSFSNEEQAQIKERANRVYSFIDRDRDGKISAEEIRSNPRLGPMFEKAGIKPTDMSQADFAKNYLRAMETYRKEGDDRRSGAASDRSGTASDRSGAASNRSGYGGREGFSRERGSFGERSRGGERSSRFGSRGSGDRSSFGGRPR